MSTIQAFESAVEFAFSDVLDHLGNIPADRICAHPTPGTATEQDAIDVNEHGDELVELVDGVLVRKPVGRYESVIAAVVIQILGDFVRPRRLGAVTAPDGMFRILPGKIRLPDVSFNPWSKEPADQRFAAAPTFSPELCIEIISPSNTVAEIRRKRGEYFQAGTRLVWVIHPVQQTVEVFRPDATTPTVLSVADQLDGGDVLPGFSVLVGLIFELAVPPAASAK